MRSQPATGRERRRLGNGAANRGETARRALPLLLLALVGSARPARGYGVDPVGARHGMVATSSELASRVGVDVLRKGGNAVDAAVAVGFALAVVWPVAGNLGGGGFLLLRRADGQTEVIDYRERAPAAARRDMYLDAQGRPVAGASSVGYRAVAVPGTVAGLALAHKRHGRIAWSELVEPARRLAADGFVVDRHLVQSLRAAAARLADFEDSRRIFLPGGKPPEVGDRLVQPELAATLGRIAKEGAREFYRGETAKRISDDMAAHGGLIGRRDLADYEPAVRAPLRGTYRGYEILTMPPPSSGGVLLLEMLNLLERFDVGAFGFHSADEIHLLVESMRRAFADRASLLGDADFVKVPTTGLVSKRYAERRAKTIDRTRATPSAAVSAGDPLPFERPQTTHYSIVDAEGNAVANTYTLNNSFGSAVVAHGTGVLLNDEMDDFSVAPATPNLYGLIQGEANAIAPRKRPLSSMTPTMVLKDGKLLFAVGSPGGPTIVNTVLQIVVNVIDFRMNLREAIDAPRFHHQYLPDQIQWEPYGLPKELRAALEARGHAFATAPTYMGDAEAVGIEPATGVRLGASDPRLGGFPVGY